MVNSKTELNVGLSTLTLKTNKANWCQVELQTDKKSYQLGAEDKTIIIERLKQALINDPLEIIGEVEGIPVAWVLSLAEKHSSIYIGIKDDIRFLFFQNETGNTFAKIKLTPETRKTWHKHLL